MGLMPSISRLLAIAALPFATLFAQEATPAAPALPPTSEGGPSANPVPDSPVAPAASPSPEAVVPAASPSVEASPTPAPDAANPTTPPAPPSDVIPMEGQPAQEGAPLDTAPIAPVDQAMPDAAFTDPNAIIPDVAPPAMPKSLDNAQERARALNIRYQEVRVKVEKDPKVASLYAQSENAKSEEEKRSALREYYRLLFKKMVEVDKTLEAKCKVMEDAYVRRLAQYRLEPTIPLNPPPTPEPLGN